MRWLVVPMCVAVAGGSGDVHVCDGRQAVMVVSTCVAVTNGGGSGYAHVCGSGRRCGGDAHVSGSGRRWWWCPRVWQWKAVVVMPTCVAVAGGGGGAHVCGSDRRSGGDAHVCGRRCGGGAHVCGSGGEWKAVEGGGGGAHVCGGGGERVWRWQAVMAVPTCVAVEGGVVVVPTCVAVVVEGGGRWWCPRVWRWQWKAVWW